MAVVLQIGAGGVGGVVAHKMAMNREVFSRIIVASRTLSKAQAIADSIVLKGLGQIEVDCVDADNVESLVALIHKYQPSLVLNVALPYQDLSIMEACLKTKTHYLDTANYEHPDSAHFEYKEQWAYDEAFKKAGIFGLLGSGFDPGVTNVFCAYALKHYFDEIESIDILDCNAGDHGYAFATNFNPEINLREVSSKARYWVLPTACSESYRSALDNSLPDISNTSEAHLPNLISDTDLHFNPDLQQDRIYRKFEREEKHFALQENTQDLKVEKYCEGEWRDIAPLSLMKEWDYPEVGRKNSYLLYHEELESLIRNIKGLKKIRFFMTFGESYLTHMKCLENVGFLRVDEVEHNGAKIVPIQVLKTLLPNPASLASRTEGKTHIGCYMRGRKNGKQRTIYIYNICDHKACYEEVNAQAVSYTTGVPAMIGAKLILEGKWGIGAVKNSSLGDCVEFANFKQNPHSLESHIQSFNAKRLKLNADMPKGGQYQGIDNGADLYVLDSNIAYMECIDKNSKILDEKLALCSHECGDKTDVSTQAKDKLSNLSLKAKFHGAGVWNMEQNDPDPFMEELNRQGLPFVVLEQDTNGVFEVLEDGRKKQA